MDDASRFGTPDVSTAAPFVSDLKLGYGAPKDGENQIDFYARGTLEAAETTRKTKARKGNG